jgi:glycosyltransferase involved in cell wall biosynthesis
MTREFWVKLEVWHNILWSAYKAGVFRALSAQAPAQGVDLQVVQIAATTRDRLALSAHDASLHSYPYELLVDGSYTSVSSWELIKRVAKRTWRSDADLTMLVEISRIEYWVQLLILRLQGRKVAVFCDSTVYDNAQTFGKGLAKRLFFALCGNVFCYGQRAEDYVRSFGIKPQNIFRRNQAAALPADYDAEAIVARRVAAGGETARFVYVGRLSPEKRIGTLIEAFAKALPQMPGAVLRIVGGGPQEAELKALAAALGLGPEEVEFPGGQPLASIFEDYLRATAMVLPSWSEPWGLVVNEALHFGCPVIVSERCGCVPELVEGTASGESFVCEDVDGLAAKLVAAPVRYGDRAAVARAALDLIAPYNADNAAAAILKGALEIQRRG